MNKQQPRQVEALGPARPSREDSSAVGRTGARPPKRLDFCSRRTQEKLIMMFLICV